MDRKLKTLPIIFMLTAGAVTSIITYVLHYEGKTALLILLAVLLLFYIIGLLFQKMIYHFEDEVDRKEKERLEEEGKVVEKGVEQSTEKDTERNTEKDTENSVKDAGEQ